MKTRNRFLNGDRWSTHAVNINEAHSFSVGAPKKPLDGFGLPHIRSFFVGVESSLEAHFHLGMSMLLRSGRSYSITCM